MARLEGDENQLREPVRHDPAEAALDAESVRRSDATLRALCDGSIEGIVLHENGIIVSANPAADSMFGFEPGGLIGHAVLDLAAPDAREMVRGAVANRRTQTYDGNAQRKDGSVFRVEVRGRTVAYGTGTIRATVLRDCSDRDEFKRAQAASTSLLRATIESTADGLLVVDRAGRIVLYNERFREIWSIPPDVLADDIDDKAIVFVEKQLVDPRTFRARIVELYDAPETESTDRLEFLDGRVIERYSRPQYVEDQIIGRVWSFRDVTSQHQAERALALAVQMRDEFIGIASHELFTPITSLAVAIRGLRGLFPGTGTDAGTRLLRGAERQIDRLTRLVQELLDVTRIDGGRLALTLEDVDLRDVARDTLDRFATELERDHVAVSLSAGTAVIGRWDRIRLEQVATNLLANAIKFGQGKPIELAVRSTPNGAQLEVLDHGIGIAPDRQAIIFERFQRAVSSRHFAGLGLGLFIARQIVEAHGGSVHLESAPGEGAKFRVELPLAVPGEVGG